MNIGSNDRMVRLLAGFALVAIAFITLGGVSSSLGILAVVVGGILVATGLFHFCPAYKLLGFSTRAK